MNVGHVFSILLLLFSVNIYSMQGQNIAPKKQEKQRKLTQAEIALLQAHTIRCLLLELPDGVIRKSDNQGQFQEGHDSANSESHTDGKHEEKEE